MGAGVALILLAVQAVPARVTAFDRGTVARSVPSRSAPALSEQRPPAAAERNPDTLASRALRLHQDGQSDSALVGVD